MNIKTAVYRLLFAAYCLLVIGYCLLDFERVKGIEPSYLAWEANVLPLNYTR